MPSTRTKRSHWLPVMSMIAVCNLEGGVGKTTVTFNVAATLAEMGHPVLLIDADPHCSLTGGLRLLAEEPTLADGLRGRVSIADAAGGNP